VQNVSRIAPITKAGGETAGKSDSLVRLSEQDSAGVRRHHPAIEICHHTACARCPKSISFGLHSVGIGGTTSKRHNSLSQNKFTPSEAPMRSNLVRNAVFYVRIVNIKAHLLDPLLRLKQLIDAQGRRQDEWTTVDPTLICGLPTA
jgi:hypothetical protein